MYYAISMQIFDSLHYIFEIFNRLSFTDSFLLLEISVKISLITEFSNDVHIVSSLINVIEFNYILMRDHLHDVNLRLYVFKIIGV
jgi:hypothetical protein